MEYLPVTFATDFEISLSGALGLLGKHVQDVDHFAELRHVENAVFHLIVNSQFNDTSANRRHRSPMLRLQSILYATEFLACVVASALGETPKVLQR